MGGYDTGFVMSDHADWPGLLKTVKDSGRVREASRVVNAYITVAQARAGFDGAYGPDVGVPYVSGTTINYDNVKMLDQSRLVAQERDNFGSFSGGRYDKDFDN